MKSLLSFIAVATLLVLSNNCVGQFEKIDSTLKLGKAGYKIFCNNKSTAENEVTIKPVGFDKDAREMKFMVKGRISKTEIDDLNDDGFPDLVVYIFSGKNAEFGTVYGFASDQNKSYVPIMLPDVMLDGKLKEGYKGHDHFMLLQGKLVREFPVYLPDGPTDKPTGGKRIIMYGIVSDPPGNFQFKVMNTYDIKS
ncbi:MAG: hypothetical protein JST47_08865 [Bacteroidetes bacterium]|nr:hypothetical protein [Bacteroidota bacterium]MBS1973757.1 hypothetical protein [Bacteroidota bacterium]